MNFPSNSIPAASSALWIAATLAAHGKRVRASKRWIDCSLTPAKSAKSAGDKLSNFRAALTCSGEILISSPRRILAGLARPLILTAMLAPSAIACDMFDREIRDSLRKSY
jgi:hypothetical protein